METQNTSGGVVNDFTPIEACNLTSKEQAERYQELKKNLFGRITSVKELTDGYDLVFNEKIEFSAQLLEFVNFERVCCPSFTFALHFESNAGPIHLEIRGSKGIKDMVAFGLKEYGQLN